MTFQAERLKKFREQTKPSDADLMKSFQEYKTRHILIKTDTRPDAEARRSARLEFGGVEQVKEECRDARGTRWIEDLWQDLHFALRTLRKTPGFAIAVMHSIYGFMVATATLDGLFLSYRQFPFACSYVPIENPKLLWPAGLATVLLVAYGFADVERFAGGPYIGRVARPRGGPARNH